MNLNLLNEPLIAVEQPKHSRKLVSLPAVLAQLSQGAAIEFPELQPHHQHPWHAFLVQLASLALDSSKESPIGSRTEEDWREDLIALTPEPAAWNLVTNDLRKPAFLQPPIPKNSLKDFTSRSFFPDSLDLLISAKNHEVKAATISLDRPEELARYLLPILIANQTFSGFSGRGLYGSFRLYGGFGNRPAVSASSDLKWSTRFRRDLEVLQKSRIQVAETHGFAVKDRIKLLWLEPWGGEKHESLRMDQLDPFCIEICRRIRLLFLGNRLTFRWGTTKGPRVDAKERLGSVGDPWTPIRMASGSQLGSALNVGSQGFNYRLQRSLIFSTDSFKPAPAQVIQAEDAAEVTFSFKALARGQGRTAGYHQRYLHVPPKVTEALKAGTNQIHSSGENLARISLHRTERVGEVQRKVLKPALLALAQGGTEQKLDMADRRILRWLSEFDQKVDRFFFSDLFSAEVSDSPTNGAAAWEQKLWETAEAIFLQAKEVLLRSTIRNHTALPQAEALLRQTARVCLPSCNVSKSVFSDKENSDSWDEQKRTLSQLERQRQKEREVVAALALDFKTSRWPAPLVSKLRKQNTELDPRLGNPAFEFLANEYLKGAELMHSENVKYLKTRWTVILKCLASNWRLHNSKHKLGRALRSASFSDHRLTRFLRARDQLLARELRRLAANLRTQAIQADWGDAAVLILSEGCPDESEVRSGIARDYLERRYTNKTIG